MGVISGGFWAGGQAGYSGNVQINILNVSGNGFEHKKKTRFSVRFGGAVFDGFRWFWEGGSVSQALGRSVRRSVGQSCARSVRRAMAGHGRSWPAMAGRGRPWPVMAGHGLPWPAKKKKKMRKVRFPPSGSIWPQFQFNSSRFE